MANFTAGVLTGVVVATAFWVWKTDRMLTKIFKGNSKYEKENIKLS